MNKYLPYICILLACFVNLPLALMIVGVYKIVNGLFMSVLCDVEGIKEKKWVEKFMVDSRDIGDKIKSYTTNILNIADIYSRQEIHFERFYFNDVLLFSYDYSLKKVTINYEGDDKEILEIVNNKVLIEKCKEVSDLMVKMNELMDQNLDRVVKRSYVLYRNNKINYTLFYFLGVIELNLFIVGRQFPFFAGLLLLTCYIIPMNFNHEKKSQKVYKKT